MLILIVNNPSLEISKPESKTENLRSEINQLLQTDNFTSPYELARELGMSAVDLHSSHLNSRIALDNSFQIQGSISDTEEKIKSATLRVKPQIAETSNSKTPKWSILNFLRRSKPEELTPPEPLPVVQSPYELIARMEQSQPDRHKAVLFYYQLDQLELGSTPIQVRFINEMALAHLGLYMKDDSVSLEEKKGYKTYYELLLVRKELRTLEEVRNTSFYNEEAI